MTPEFEVINEARGSLIAVHVFCIAYWSVSVQNYFSLHLL